MLGQPYRPKDRIAEIAPLLPKKFSPLTATGNGLQPVYLTELPDDLGLLLLEIAGVGSPNIVVDDAPDDGAVADLIGRTDIGETEKAQLINARRGQGIFKANVRLNEQQCRLTGVSNIRHLIASHIKPWAVCSDEEKLDGRNGLLLAPHVDHLFDRGWISFTDEGDLVLSPLLEVDLLGAWGIAFPLNVGPFSEGQRRYLEYHREHVLRRAIR